LPDADAFNMIKPLSVLVLFLLFISTAIAQEEKFESIIALNQKNPTAALAQLKKYTPNLSMTMMSF
jgi:PhoPQ-activated pathogenicity-related protein